MTIIKRFYYTFLCVLLMTFNLYHFYALLSFLFLFLAVHRLQLGHTLKLAYSHHCLHLLTLSVLGICCIIYWLICKVAWGNIRTIWVSVLVRSLFQPQPRLWKHVDVSRSILFTWMLSIIWIPFLHAVLHYVSFYITFYICITYSSSDSSMCVHASCFTLWSIIFLFYFLFSYRPL